MSENKKNIEISEQDVFNYVFFKDRVSSEKIQLIEVSKDYSEVINFYIELKRSQDQPLAIEIKNKLASKIPAYSKANIVNLHPLKVNIQITTNGNRLAADSKELKPKMTTKTFVDNDKEYMIKVLNYGGITKVFVFSTKDEVVNNFDIVIEPHNLVFHFDDNSEPLKIEKDIEAEKIELRFT